MDLAPCSTLGKEKESLAAPKTHTRSCNFVWLSFGNLLLVKNLHFLLPERRKLQSTAKNKAWRSLLAFPGRLDALGNEVTC